MARAARIATRCPPLSSVDDLRQPLLEVRHLHQEDLAAGWGRVVLPYALARKYTNADIRRRFPRSLWHLLHDFSHRVDRCTCFMNHGARPVLVFEQNGLTRTIHDHNWYQLLLHQAQA